MANMNDVDFELEKESLIAGHVKEIMTLLQIVPSENNNETPQRLAKMWNRELFANVGDKNMTALDFSMTKFPVSDLDNGPITLKNIPFSSICEHHWLPFSGVVHVCYLPNKEIIGLSKIPRVVKYFSKMPQIQERLTRDIAYYLNDILEPAFVMVVVEAKHQCVSCRGAEIDCSTITHSTLAHPNTEPESLKWFMDSFYREIGR